MVMAMVVLLSGALVVVSWMTTKAMPISSLVDDFGHRQTMMINKMMLMEEQSVTLLSSPVEAMDALDQPQVQAQVQPQVQAQARSPIALSSRSSFTVINDVEDIIYGTKSDMDPKHHAQHQQTEADAGAGAGAASAGRGGGPAVATASSLSSVTLTMRRSLQSVRAIAMASQRLLWALLQPLFNAMRYLLQTHPDA